ALAAGAPEVAVALATSIVDRVYRQLDRPRADDGLPLPGVAPEFWPEPVPSPGGAESHNEMLWQPAEAYGWGANCALYLLRYLIGFVESDDISRKEFTLRPALPLALRTPGALYTVRNLNIRGAHFDLSYLAVSATALRIGLRRQEAGAIA